MSSLEVRQSQSPAMPRQSTDTVDLVDIDIGKNTLHLVGPSTRRAIILSLRLPRRQLEDRLAFLAEAPIASDYV